MTKQVVIGEIMAGELLDLLNKAIAKELAVSIQYMWQHVMAMGMESPEIKDIFKDISIEEMKQAERLAERLFYLGGIPTTKPEPINVGHSLKEMIEFDLKVENEAIEMYREIIDVAVKEEDTTTRLLCEKILAEEEEQKNKLSKLLK